MRLSFHDTCQAVQQLFDARGAAWYGGESVSQLEHALQAAMFAEQESASAATIVAALLHDIGHLLHQLPEDAADQGLDDRHEVLAVDWLRERFGPAVFEPVGMHVAAKRYLCAVEPNYHAGLSPASQQSLKLQGGPMSPEESTAFEQQPFFAEGIRLRRWDDAAKVVGLATPGLEHFATYVESCTLEPEA